MQDSSRTAAGGHKHEAVLARQRGVDGLALVGAEGAVAKVVVVGLRQVRRPEEVVARPAPVCAQPQRLSQVAFCVYNAILLRPTNHSQHAAYPVHSYVFKLADHEAPSLHLLRMCLWEARIAAWEVKCA